MPASVSSWTRAAYEDLDSADELATQQDEDDELLYEEGEDPSGWFMSMAASGRSFFLASGLAPVCVAPPSRGLLAEELEEEKRTRLTVFFARRTAPCIWQSLVPWWSCLRSIVCGFFWYSALLGSTVGTCSCQSTEASWFSLFFAYPFPEVDSVLSPDATHFWTNFTRFHDDCGLAPEVDSRPARSVRASVYGHFWTNFTYFPDEGGLGP